MMDKRTLPAQTANAPAADRPVSERPGLFPSLFVSHGAPTLLLEDVPARHFLAGYGVRLGKPRAVIVVSAHDTADAPVVTSAARHHAVHDYRGFPDELYRMRYSPAGDAGLAERVADALAMAQIRVERREDGGLDHGAWVPLKLMYPDADVPVVSLALDLSLSNRRLIDIGRTLATFRADGVLILASGSLTHNLHEFRPGRLHSPPPDYVREFSAWVEQTLRQGDEAALLHWQTQAPHAQRAHPTPEHFLPLLLAYGAGGGRVSIEHASYAHSVLAMHVLAFA